MKPDRLLKHEFVEFIPDTLQDGVLYISIPLATASHKCVCGCGNEVVTPLTPTDWQLVYDGESVSLDPSIGNWSFPCHSHYWIVRNRASWAPQWSEGKIAAGRTRDRITKQRHFDQTEAQEHAETKSVDSKQSHARKNSRSKSKK